jgi:acetyl-CoA acetyltransferase
VDLANGQLFGLGHEQINIHGGAMSLGHPIGPLGIFFETEIIARFKHLHCWKEIHFATNKDLTLDQLDNMI